MVQKYSILTARGLIAVSDHSSTIYGAVPSKPPLMYLGRELCLGDTLLVIVNHLATQSRSDSFFFGET